MPYDIVKDFLPNTWRMATHPLRHLPTTVIVGAQKAGTTQLLCLSGEAPAVLPGSKKGSRLLFEALRTGRWPGTGRGFRYRCV